MLFQLQINRMQLPPDNLSPARNMEPEQSTNLVCLKSIQKLFSNKFAIRSKLNCFFFIECRTEKVGQKEAFEMVVSGVYRYFHFEINHIANDY